MTSEGFIRIGKCNEWTSCFFHPEDRTFLVIYVDDFIMSGTPTGLKKSWSILRTGERSIAMEDPHPAAQLLGCKCDIKDVTSTDGKTVAVLEQDMESFLKSCL